MKLKILTIIFTLVYQTQIYSKATDANEFNQKYLSDYFSALISYNSNKNDLALKYFNSSKSLISKHEIYLKRYVFALIEDGEVLKAIKQIQNSKNYKNSYFFEAYLLLVVENLRKKNFTEAKKNLLILEKFKENGTYELIIYETLNGYNELFLNKRIKNSKNNFGNLTLITKTFQNCYLNSEKTESLFANLIDTPNRDYSRYIFFYLNHLIENNKYNSAKSISSSINPLNSTLLVSQTKKWIDNSNYNAITKYFSCKSESDILSEFFFLISNLYSSQEKYKKSNFYMNISNYLNPKFYFNLSLISENYFKNNNLDLAKKFLIKFDKKNKIYYWYKVKKMEKIIAKKENEKNSLKYIENKFKELKNPTNKIFFDMGNIYKSHKKFNKAIEYYSKVLKNIDKNSTSYADILFRRGICYERLEEFKKSDEDLIKSLNINPDDPYVLNYLAYSWLERNYKIDEAMEMLKSAYKQKENDPYIIDSIGWGYYLTGDYISAEKYMQKAVMLMPDDPIVNDHYGDILWRLNRKIQAQFFWKSVLDLEEAKKQMKEKISLKLLKGLKKI